MIQRFGSAANLNIHLHCLVLDGVYRCGADGAPGFIEAGAPTDDTLHELLHTLIARLMKLLTRRGVLVEDMGQTYLAEPDTDSEESRTLRPLQAAALGRHKQSTGLFVSGLGLPHCLRPPRRTEGADAQGLSVDTGPPLWAGPCLAKGSRLQARARPARPTPRETTPRQALCADIDGFNLHAAVRVEAHDRKRLEQLCRYITRPALSDERVQLNAAGQVELKLKTPWRDGTTHLVMSPLEFMQRLAAGAAEGRPSGSRAAAEVAPDQFGVRTTSLREVSGPPLREPRSIGPEGEAAACGSAPGTRGARAGQRSNRCRRVRGRDGPDPTAAHQLGAAAQARVRHRYGAVPELRRRGAEEHRGHP
ncbi:MAG: transposase [Betaproteobacteria bacterium]